MYGCENPKGFGAEYPFTDAQSGLNGEHNIRSVFRNCYNITGTKKHLFKYVKPAVNLSLTNEKNFNFLALVIRKPKNKNLPYVHVKI